MAVSYINIASSNPSEKIAVAELRDIAIVMPTNKALTSGGTVANDAGIPVPISSLSATSNGAGNVSGTVAYAITFVDSTRGQEGAPISTIEVTVAGKAMSLSFSGITNESLNSTVDKIYVYRTLAGGNVLFLTGSTCNTATGFLDDNTDATISGRDTLLVGEQARSVPVAKGFIIRHGQRLFSFGPEAYHGTQTGSPEQRWGDEGNRAYWSEIDRPQSWPSRNAVDIGDSTPLRSAAPLGDAIAVFKENDIYLWIYRTDPDGNTGDGSIQNMQVNRGACTFKSVVNVDGSLFVMDFQGWYLYKGGQAILDLTEPVRGILDRVNWDEVAQICGTYDEQRVYWFLPLDGDTTCKHALVLDRRAFESGRGVRWWLYEFPQGVADCDSTVWGRDSRNVTAGIVGRRTACVITDLGYEFAIFHAEYTDGVHPDLSTDAITSGAASQTFTVQSGTLLSGNNDLRGVPVRFYGDDRITEPQIISSVTSTEFTIENGLGFNVATSTSVTFGGIGCRWTSRLFEFDGPHDLKGGMGIDIEYEPTGKNSQIGVWGSTDRRGPVISQSSGDHTGWEVSSNEESIRVDMGGKLSSNGRSGFTEIPLQVRNFSYLQIAVGSSLPNTNWTLTALAVSQRKSRTDR